MQFDDVTCLTSSKVGRKIDFFRPNFKVGRSLPFMFRSQCFRDCEAFLDITLTRVGSGVARTRSMLFYLLFSYSCIMVLALQDVEASATATQMSSKYRFSKIVKNLLL